MSIEAIKVLLDCQLSILDLILKLLYRSGMQQDMEYAKLLQMRLNITLDMLDSDG